MTEQILAWLDAALDRWGADLAAWPDPTAADQARKLVLAEPMARGLWEAARQLERQLASDRDALDEELRRDGAVERIAAAVLAQPPIPAARSWYRAVAGLAAAALLGMVVSFATPWPTATAEVETVALGPLVFGPLEGSDL